MSITTLTITTHRKEVPIEVEDTTIFFMELYRLIKTKQITPETIFLQEEINKLNEFGLAPLHYAVRDNYWEAFILLLNNGAKVNIQDKDGSTVAHYAAEYGLIDMLNKILERDKSVANISDNRGIGPLWVACHNAKGKYELVEILLKNGADPNHKNNTCKSPIDMATNRGYKEMLNLLMKYSK